MSFDSQRDFNKFMDGYMDNRIKKRSVQRASFFARKPRPAPARIDRAVELEDKELKEVVEPKEQKKKRISLLQKLMFFANDAAKQEKEARKALGKDIEDDDLDAEFLIDDVEPKRQQFQQRQVSSAQASQFYARPQQPPPQRKMGPISNGVPISSLRQTSIERHPEVREVEQKFPYSPSTEKDVKYLLGLVNTLLNKLELSKRQDFYRSSEYRIFESVRKKY